ncbi:MAG: tRNA (adenosine(37)-N6)-threonylcarbamoyltransferase complex transferase subunit TsaD, partial [Candidatus Omnitrophica bacterium]|nr:tRNA (adenosine(37)-N6)-threonylcarbamoyltransferase complex transferase subunit TsaD [Candidatus Omnitrophota bacterium]
MYTLGIETSCDETAASLVYKGSTILSNIIATSLPLHEEYGGIIPEIASRMQLEAIAPVVSSAIRSAKKRVKDIDLISVTNGPGLLGSLIVGLSFAKALSAALAIPVLGVNHLYSHIFASFLNQKDKIPRFPFVALIVSGGHTSLFYVQGFDRITLLGKTLDDAAGEAFDKVAKILGLGYPGGPIIERLAQGGDPRRIPFNCSRTSSLLDFSFSGIKTAVLYYVRAHIKTKTRLLHFGLCKDIAASFQEAVFRALIEKSLAACRAKGSRVLVVGGGVASNHALRNTCQAALQRSGIRVFFPSRRLSVDNAAMVASLGYYLHKAGRRDNLYLNV